LVRKTTRRRFLTDSLLATAGALAAAQVPTAALAQDGDASPNDILGVAVVGVKGRGGSHLGAFLGDPRTQILYVVDPDTRYAEERASQAEEKQGFRPKTVTDMREAFDDPAVDIVSTATPNHWHALTAIWAMQAGKDVYVEKPVSWSIAEGRAMVEAARKYGRICQVGTQCRSHAAIRDAMQFIQDGGIGECNFSRGLCYKRRASIGPWGNYTSEIPDTVDYNLWCGPATYTEPKMTRPSLHYDWHWQRHYGNGDLGNQGPHQTDIARWGLGLQRHPSAVIAYGGRLGYDAERKDPNYVDAGDVANTEVSIYDYGDKCIVFETRGLETPDLMGAKIGVIFYGSDGYLVQSSYSHCTVFDKDMNVVREFTGGGSHFGNFIECVLSRNARFLHADVLEGHYSAALSHLGNISYYLGEDNKVTTAEAAHILADVPSLDDNVETLDRTVEHLKANGVSLVRTPLAMGPHLQFDPEREVFPGNAEANAMLTREYREPFVCPPPDKV
jgi:predicted dehydrogenase